MSDNLIFRILNIDTEQPEALDLLARCFPQYWEQIAARNHQFPFEEISFGAFLNGQLVGHCGVLPYTIELGSPDQMARMGGIASVAVAPECRGMGIACQLCAAVSRWAEEQGYASLPLYTAFDRVYQHSGWSNFTAYTPAAQIQFPTHLRPQSALHPLPCKNFSAVLQKNYQDLYHHGFSFRGKVLRGSGRQFHGWARLFNDPDYSFHLQQDVGCVFFDHALVECNFSPRITAEQLTGLLSAFADESNALDVSLPAVSPVWNLLQQAGCRITPGRRDLMHGEHPMYLDLRNSSLHAMPLEYPLADKF